MILFRPLTTTINVALLLAVVVVGLASNTAHGFTTTTTTTPFVSSAVVPSLSSHPNTIITSSIKKPRVHHHPTQHHQHVSKGGRGKANTRNHQGLLLASYGTLERDPKGMANDYPIRIVRIAMTILSTWGTWYIANHKLPASLGLGVYTTILSNPPSAVLVSTALTLFGSGCVDRRLGQALYCGSLAGMSSSLAVLPNWQYAVGLGTLTSMMYEVFIHSQNVFMGIGGRLGATAFLATSIMHAAISTPKIGVIVSAAASAASSIISSIPKSVPSVLNYLQKDAVALICSPLVLWYSVGAVTTYVLRQISDDTKLADPIRASALIGLIGAIFFHNYYKQPQEVVLALFGGTFVGMTLPSKLLQGFNYGRPLTKLVRLLATFATAGAMGGIINGIMTNTWATTTSWGGSTVGFCSFMGVMLFRGISSVMEKGKSIVMKQKK